MIFAEYNFNGDFSRKPVAWDLSLSALNTACLLFGVGGRLFFLHNGVIRKLFLLVADKGDNGIIAAETDVFSP